MEEDLNKEEDILQPCTTENNEPGWRGGDEGTCFVGADAKEKAQEEYDKATETVEPDITSEDLPTEGAPTTDEIAEDIKGLLK